MKKFGNPAEGETVDEYCVRFSVSIVTAAVAQVRASAAADSRRLGLRRRISWAPRSAGVLFAAPPGGGGR